jgi:hypothetical protein
MEKYYLSFTTRDSDFAGGVAPKIEYTEMGQSIKNAAAKELGFTTISHNSDTLKATKFYADHRHIFNNVRGFGFWLWKPYFISQLMASVDYGDIIFYLDAGNPKPITENINLCIDVCMKNGGFFFLDTSGHRNGTWTKRDCFYYLNSDTDEVRSAVQSVGGFQIYQKNPATIDFVNEWLHYCCDRRLISDEPNVCGMENYPEFRDHRHDQAILTLVRIKNGISTSGLRLHEI